MLYRSFPPKSKRFDDANRRRSHRAKRDFSLFSLYIVLSRFFALRFDDALRRYMVSDGVVSFGGVGVVIKGEFACGGLKE